MKQNRRLILISFGAMLFILLGIAAEKLYFSDFEYHFRTKRFTRVISEKEGIMDNCLNDLKLILAKGEPHGSVSENNLFSIAEENEITILEYIDDKLIYWSDNGFNVPRILFDSTFTKPLVFLQNGWFLPKTVRAGNELIVGLLRIRTEYELENNIVKSGFGKAYKIPHDAGFSLEENSSEYAVRDRSGAFLFSLIFNDKKTNTPLIILPLFMWTCVLVLVILASLSLAGNLAGKKRTILGISSCFIVFAILYGILLLAGKPEVLFRTALFSPFRFSLNGFIPSLGHLLVFSIIVSVLAYMIFRHLDLSIAYVRKQKSILLTNTILLVSGALALSLVHLIFSHLVSDSNINFEPYKVLNLDLFSVAGYSCVIILLLVPILSIFKFVKFRNDQVKKPTLIPVIISLAIIGLFFNKDLKSLITVTILFLLLLFIALVSERRKGSVFNTSVLFSLLLGLYSLLIILINSEKKATENLKVQALTLSTENDPEAEHLLLDMWPEFESDLYLKELMGVEFFDQIDYDRIYSYLHDTYFSGYWGNFQLGIFLCRKDDPLRLGPEEDNLENCFGFFDERVRKNGHQLTGTGFYFIDNQGGRSFYLGRLFYTNSSGYENGLFIELYSDVNVFQPGYSELLLDKRFRSFSGLKDYSFAKYINGEIVINSGEFPYNKADDEYVDKNRDYRNFNDGGFRHVLYRNGNATVIISKPKLSAGDIIISFAYLFSYLFIFLNLILLLFGKPAVKALENLNFRQKLQFSFIGILLASFLMVGAVVVLITIREFRSKHNDNLKEKLNSIYLELDSKLASEKQLSNDWRNSTNSSLKELLVKLSNIFNTDINLYDLNGFLLASSREEIFIRDLAGRRINNLALINLKDLTKSEYMQTEKIGNMKYLSVYVPFYNAEEKELAYLNLPYFRMQSIITREISNLIVAVLNFTLLLILLTMGLTVFISGRLTSPLSMLSGGLASVELGKKTEHLKYEGKDEIGDLVKQYNRMVDELENSANKLADSEREYAWREMAKQIAHEIKNPLTPMKLNVQQLLKSWKDKAPSFGEKLEGFSKNQIEYIDNLSTIASAFSSFARMPGTNPVEVDLLEQIKTTLDLFKDADNVTFRVNWPHERKVIIHADREHLNGIFSNLFKNSIQAISPGREGLINVTLEVIRNKVLVSVEDNGSGIPEELQKKLFTPNFTTKSSGTGLGLSIVKKYVEGIKGRIWFESESERGTTFHIEFPLKYTVETPGGVSKGA
jgi:two-component system, NtrC family, nitrogen regulation sensor histidine kinase NtrY